MNIQPHVSAIQSHLKAQGISPTAKQAPQIIRDAQAAAHRKVFGAKGVDEGTATKANDIENGLSVAAANKKYTRVGSRNYPSASLSGSILPGTKPSDIGLTNSPMLRKK